MKILDVGCGAGKQCFTYHDYLKGNADITGGDVNEELLEKARRENEKRGTELILLISILIKFPVDDQFDFESCCFAIYYAEDIPFTIREMHRVLKPGGRLFSSGPMPANKKMFYDVISEATGQNPPMPGSSRYSTQILDAMKATFQSGGPYF